MAITNTVLIRRLVSFCFRVDNINAHQYQPVYNKSGNSNDGKPQVCFRRKAGIGKCFMIEEIKQRKIRSDIKENHKWCDCSKLIKYQPCKVVDRIHCYHPIWDISYRNILWRFAHCHQVWKQKENYLSTPSTIVPFSEPDGVEMVTIWAYPSLASIVLFCDTLRLIYMLISTAKIPPHGDASLLKFLQ